MLDAKDGAVVAALVDIKRLNKNVNPEELARNWYKLGIGPFITPYNNYSTDELLNLHIQNEGKYFFKCIPPGKYGVEVSGGRIGEESEDSEGDYYTIIKIYPGKNEINFLLDFTKAKPWEKIRGDRIVEGKVVRGKVRWKMPSRRKRKKKRTSAEGGEM